MLYIKKKLGDDFMGKFEDFDLDLKEDKVNATDIQKAAITTDAVCWSIGISVSICTTIKSKTCSGSTGNCNITKISKCNGIV